MTLAQKNEVKRIMGVLEEMEADLWDIAGQLNNETAEMSQDDYDDNPDFGQLIEMLFDDKETLKEMVSKTMDKLEDAFADVTK